MLEKYALFKVIKYLINTIKEYSIRELAKKANVGITTAKICLDYLLSKNIVKRRIIGRSYQYELNLENILVKYIKILFSLNSIIESKLIDELVKKYPVSSIVLYGSVARGEDDPKSDIDVLIITRKKIKLGHLKSTEFLKKEVTFLVYTVDEWRKKAKSDKVFYDRLILDGIALYGEMPVVA